MRAGDRAAFETRRCIADALHDCSESFQFDASFPHRHQRSLLRGPTMQRRLRIDFLEIAQNRRYFTDGCAVLQYQGRNHSTRIDSAIRGGELFTFAEIDRNKRYRQTLLGEKNSTSARIAPACFLLCIISFVSNGQYYQTSS